MKTFLVNTADFWAESCTQSTTQGHHPTSRSIKLLISQAIVSVGGQWAPLCIIWYHAKKKQFLVTLNNILWFSFFFSFIGGAQKIGKKSFLVRTKET